MVTIRNVAEHCGMSIAAVSRALNGQSGVSPERAAWIRQKAQELGYYPNAAARALKTNRTNLIGVLYFNLLAHEYFSVVLEGVHAEAAARGYELTFLNSTPELSVFDHARQRQCAGVLLVQDNGYMDGYAPATGEMLPTVALEQSFTDSPVIMTDNVSAMEEVIRYLYDKGHRRIAFIHGEPAGQVTKDRLAGYYRGCRNCGISAPEEYIYEGKYRNLDISAEGTRTLLALAEPPTCIIYPDDLSYLGGMAEIERQGLRIPRDVSCFGFDGVMLSRLLQPRLTTYFQDAESIGRRAVKELIDAIEDPRCAVPQTIFVPGHIQEGGTVRDLTKEDTA